MEIKKGDKIKLKRDIINNHGISESTINKLSNRILTVSHVDFCYFVRILEDDEGYLWSIEMFDKIDIEGINTVLKNIKNEIYYLENVINQ